MKKLNITKERFNTSKYFQTKYGKLKYVSESGNVYKTDKDVILEFRMPNFGEIGDALDDGVSKIKKLLHKKPQFKMGDCVTCYEYSDENHGKGKGNKVGIGKVIKEPTWAGALNTYMYKVEFPFSGFGLDEELYTDEFPEYRIEPGDEQQYEQKYDEYKKKHYLD